MPESLQHLSPAQQELIAVAARMAQQFGFPASSGQVYGLLYASPRPLCLDDLVRLLGLSKTSASTATRQLLNFSLIRQAWLPGERKDHFEARTDLREVMRINYQTLVKPRLEQAERRLEGLARQVEAERADGLLAGDAHAIAVERLAQLRRLQSHVSTVLPAIEELM